MIRFRQALIVAALAAATSIPACFAQAQRGPSGRGGPGGPGGPGGSTLNLAQNPAIQEELKLKDPQKTKIRTLVESFDQRRRQLFDQMNPRGQRGGPGGNGRRNRGNNNANPQNGGGGQNGVGYGGYGLGYGGYGGMGGLGGYGYGGMGGLGGYGYGGLGGYGGYGMYGGGGFGQGGPGSQGNAGGPDPEMAERMAAMREAQMELEQSGEQALASILDRGQYSRLKQIELQLAGMSALIRPDMIEKLNLEEDQVEQIQELVTQSRQAQRENGRGVFDMMRTAFDQGNNGPNAGGGGPGGRRGPGGLNPGDPAAQDAMKTFMEKPEVKAKVDEMQAQNTKIENQLAATVNRVLGRRQAAAYKKMLGPPFDISRFRGGPAQGPGNKPPGATQTDRTKVKGSGSDKDEAATADSASKTKNTDANAKSKRKSLRQQRGLDD